MASPVVLTMYDGSWVSTMSVAALNGELQNAKVVFIPGAGSGESLLSVPSELAGEFRFRPLPFPELPGLLGLRGPRFQDEPLAGSPGSGAQYLVVHATPDRFMLELVQFLPPHAVTSIHYHEREDEWFFSLAGACELTLGTCRPGAPARARLTERLVLRAVPRTDTASVQQRLDRAIARRTKTLDPAPPFDLRRGVPDAYVRPGTVHQLRTVEEAALNLIRIRATDAQTLQALAHCFVEWDER